MRQAPEQSVNILVNTLETQPREIHWDCKICWQIIKGTCRMKLLWEPEVVGKLLLVQPWIGFSIINERNQRFWIQKSIPAIFQTSVRVAYNVRVAICEIHSFDKKNTLVQHNFFPYVLMHMCIMILLKYISSAAIDGCHKHTRKSYCDQVKVVWQSHAHPFKF